MLLCARLDGDAVSSAETTQDQQAQKRLFVPGEETFSALFVSFPPT